MNRSRWCSLWVKQRYKFSHEPVAVVQFMVMHLYKLLRVIGDDGSCRGAAAASASCANSGHGDLSFMGKVLKEIFALVCGGRRPGVRPAGASLRSSVYVGLPASSTGGWCART